MKDKISTGNLFSGSRSSESIHLKVLQLIRAREPLSKIKIADELGISPATSGLICEELLKYQLLSIAGEGKSSGGRRPILLQINNQSKFVVGCDIGGTHIGSVVSDLKGNIFERHWIQTDPHDSIEKTFENIQASIHSAIQKAGVKQTQLLGIGLSVPGLLDIANGVSLFAPNLPNWRNVPIVSQIQAAFHLPVIIDNDARAMALGEYRFGAGQGYKDLICVNVGIGIGSGIIIDGRLHRGNGGGSGEIGHVTVNENGPHCVCGNNGCLELMASGPAIAARAIQAISTGTHTLINDLSEGQLINISARLVAEAAQSGDQLAIAILSDAGRYVGIGVATLINLLSPQLVIIGGGVALSGEHFLSMVKSTAAERAYSTMVNMPTIVASELKENASVLGAVALVIDWAFSSLDIAFSLPSTRRKT